MLSASSTALRTDKAYVDLLEAQSTWPFHYVFARPNPVNSRAQPMWGLQDAGVPPQAIDSMNALLPANFRVQTRASQNRPQTELFGTSPFLARGAGVLKTPDVSSQLLEGTYTSQRGSRSIAELPFDRQDFVAVPPALAGEGPEVRYGALTRVAPSYMQPRDP